MSRSRPCAFNPIVEPIFEQTCNNRLASSTLATLRGASLPRMTGHIFVAEHEDQPPLHPYESLGTGLLRATAEVKLGPAGPEAEFDRKGIQKLQKESDR